MLVPITLRIPKEILNKIRRISKEKKVAESEYLREVIEKGLQAERQEQVLKAYQNGEIHVSEAARRLDLNLWDFLGLLAEKNLSLNVSLEDWLDSKSL